MESNTQPWLGSIKEALDEMKKDASMVDYRDPKGRFVVVYNHTKRAYQALGKGAYTKRISSTTFFDKRDDAIEHAELEIDE